PSDRLLAARICRSWRSCELRRERLRSVSRGRHLYRSCSQGRETSRHACRTADQVRTGYQPANCEGNRYCCAAKPACAGRRGDRIEVTCPLMAQSRHAENADVAIGGKRTYRRALHMSAFDTQSGHSAIIGAYVKLSIVVTAHGTTWRRTARKSRRPAGQ